MTDPTFADYMAARWAPMYRVAYVLAGNAHDAEDLLQSAMAKTCLTWDTIRDKGAVDAYVRHVAPELADRVRKHVGKDDVFAEFRIEEQLLKALDSKVWLPSGGYLVIDSTEAMTVIDVNTGKFTGSGGNLEETVTRNNLE